MKNKNTIVFLTLVITALCLYYLSITFFSRGIQADAIEYAKNEQGVIDQSKKQAYLDSIWLEPVLNLLGAEFTYKEIKEQELNLGLDLQGGMHVTLEVSPVEIIKGLAGNSQDANFLRALELATERQRNSQAPFTQLFQNAYNEVNPDGRLSRIFANAANRGKISFESTNAEVMQVIEEEVDQAIDRAFQILRTRVDRFGTSQPNIQRIQGTGRIQIELPGVDNPARVRKLLQGVAKLEFWEVYRENEILPTLNAINEEALKIEKLSNSNSLNTEINTAAKEGETPNSLEAKIAQTDSAKTDSTSLDAATSGLSKFFSLRRQGPYQGFFYNLADTSQINRILKHERIKRVIPANLDFKWGVKPVEETELLILYPIKVSRGEAPLTGEVITDARQTLDERARPAVSMQMNTVGAKKWKNITGQNINRQIAIVLDNYVYTAPNVTGEIPNGSSSISGNFTQEEAEDLANILKAGSLPAPTRIVEEAVVGPTLGKEAQRQGVTSIVAGLLIVIVFMIFYYAKGGIVANVALLFNIFFILGILANIGSALTLPGIAGIVLTIGMSIDANVLIFERIREELRNGIPLLQAISSGYQKAYSSIIDANVTTLLTGAILYFLGQGPVKGFAITLIIGIICSFFSAVFITRVIVTWMTKKGNDSNISFETPLSRGWLSNINLDFLGKRRMAYIISAVVITLGISALFTSGLRLGVDFKGGRSYVVEFDEPMVASDIKSALSSGVFTEAGVEVKTYDASNVLKITTSYLVDEESTEADNQVKDALTQGIENATGKTFVDGTVDLSEGQFTIGASSKVGATIADDIKKSSFEAFGLSILAIFVYILARFRRWQFSLGAILALIHDATIVLSAFAIAGWFGLSFEIDQVFIASLLTIIGYSINDTVVVFDRIRENLQLKGGKDLIGTFNMSINSTISRTLITSMTTLIVVLVLLIFGGEVLRGFSFALLVGILVGTYSSVFIATPTVVDLTKKTLTAAADKEQASARAKAAAKAEASAQQG
ncbi:MULTISPECIES: protein translocase subunit SecDF [Roseivirga]|jgi:SecD/SecF fusion protein|uniref:protein translocase subunit SecDF n=1 Tax=Roseivirga TaxID=290180 RepID=UPI00257CC3F9|nr:MULTISPECIES: protein translocase subunit SecDF [Roseivirga]|tara:strand:- start:5824 stop:8850 length:3027 start_codon:yes stop_codon:yes gene_type:complete